MTALSTGPFTFLFTDIEGSTQRWEHQRAAMALALVRHDAPLMRAYTTAWPRPAAATTSGRR